MPAYPRITQIPNTYAAQQTFTNSITVNGITMRPTVTRSSGDTIATVDYLIDGVWKTVHSVTNPVPA